MKTPTFLVPWLEKSTNDRFNGIVRRHASERKGDQSVDLGRAAFQLFSRVAPEAAEQHALRRFLTPPPPRPPSTKMADLLTRADDRFTLRLRTTLGGIAETSPLYVALWGRGPAVYLVHGWGGRASQWVSFIEPLVEAGFTAVAFDAPGHGDSHAPRTSIPHFAAALAAVVDSVGPARSVIGHSLGAAACGFALQRGTTADSAVVLGAMANPPEVFARFLTNIGLSEERHPAINAAFEKQFGFRSSELAIRPPDSAPDLPLLVVHDRDDGEVPYSNAERIARAWPKSTLLPTSGLGHHRILRSDNVIRNVVSFVSGASAS